MLDAQTRLTLSDSVLGTAEYMSPEQARGDEALDHRADLYSAGVVLYEMLTARTPFHGGSSSAVIYRILHEAPADPRTLCDQADPHLASLALRLMAKRPEDRFASAGEAIEALKAGERVRSLERRRRFRRGIALGLVAFLVVLGGAWLLSGFAAQAPITEVKVDENDSRKILAWYGAYPDPEVFYQFRDEEQKVNDVVLVDPYGDGHTVVVAGLNRPIDGDSVLAFNTEGKGLWGLGLSSDRQWPDCGRPTQWYCKCLAAGDLDGERGEEIVAMGSDLYEYATRVSIINPRTEEIKATFWHMGHLSRIRILPDFFGPGRPAIIADGLNNKLDCFDDGSRDDPLQLAHWDVVQVVMILDPRDVLRQRVGLGPPRTARVNIPPARVYAYAYLDLPHQSNVPYVPTSEKEAKPVGDHEEGVGQINAVEDALYEDTDNAGPWFFVRVMPPAPDEKPNWGRAGLVIDRHLELCEVKLSWVEEPVVPDEYWRGLWCPIIQEYKYADE